METNIEEHTFFIRIIPVNNNPPHFNTKNPQATIIENGKFPLTGQLLKVTDEDTPLSYLQVTLTRAPALGVIERIHEGSNVIIQKGIYSY